MTSVFSKKRIVVTGGAGAFGQKFVKYVAPAEPASVTVLSRDEMKHAAMKRSEPFKSFPWLRWQIGDICNRDDLRRAFLDADIVIHAAAMKHLPECEANVFASNRVNIEGTQNVIDEFFAGPVKDLVFLSSDKAAYAASVYGAQKFVGEKIITAAAERGLKNKRCYSLRYSNVIDSTGAVFHIFSQLLKSGGTASVNGAQTSRGFVTQREVLSLLEETLQIAKGGEIFVPVPQVVRIGELAQTMSELLQSGSVKVESLGVGEKEYATLIMAEELSWLKKFPGKFSEKVRLLDPLKRHTELEAGKLPSEGAYLLEHCPTLGGADLKSFLKQVMEENGVL